MTTMRRIGDSMRRALAGVGLELGRLNRCGIDAALFCGRSRRERARIVAATLERRHREPTRCC